jgi:hypothetical protein
MDTSNQAKAATNELQVLQAIGQVGWLSVTQIARWVWGGHNPRSARVSAERVLKRLIERGDVLPRASSLRMSVYILTKSGALRANEALTHPLFRHGYDLSQLDSARQRPAVDYLITQHHQGKIAMGIAGLRKAMEMGLIEQDGLRGADGVVIDEKSGEFKPILVIRNAHPELVKKAQRIKKATGDIELIGSAGLIRFFRQELRS